MNMPAGSERNGDPDEEVTELERGAEKARRKLAEAEAQADETLEQAEEKLRKRDAELEADAQRLRRAIHEPTGPSMPPARKERDREPE